jgi:hypothetical protein
MKKYTKIQKTTSIDNLQSITCDICGTTYSLESDVFKDNYNYDYLEMQEFLSIAFIGGYGSIFGDGEHVECDICQHCLHKMIKGKYRIIDEEFYGRKR